MSLTLDLTGRVALVTGGYRGVGSGISAVLVEAGATVVTCGRSEAEPLPGTTHRRCDVRDPDSVQTLVDGVVADHGSLDVLVNNAGGSPWGLAAEMPAERHRKIIELNLVSALVVSQVVNAQMQHQDGGGSIVSISSVSGVRPSPGTASYGAAKAGLDHLTRSLAIEWAPRVRVNAIDLGMTSTPALEEFYGAHFDDGAAALAGLAGTVPMRRLATPRDAGRLVAFLCSPLASHVSGSCIELHGGGEAKEFLDELKESEQ